MTTLLGQKLMIDVDIEAPGITRGMRRSGLSFSISVIVHLAMFLVLALMIFSPTEKGALSLNVSSVEDFSEMTIEDGPTFQVEAPESALELEELEFEEQDDAPIEFQPDQLDSINRLAENPLDVMEVSTSLETFDVEYLAPTRGFFGIEATGNRIIYLIDNSPSMAAGKYGRRYDRAVDEVMNSVDQLRPEQEFFVFLFSHRYIPMNINGEMQFCFPTESNKAGLESWLRSVDLGSGTDPREALVAALEMNPSCCFLLSDGEFNGRRYKIGKYGSKTSAVILARRNNHSSNPIHTIGLEDKGNQKDMTKIAKQSGGVYKFIPAGG